MSDRFPHTEPTPYWTKDRAGAMAAACGAGYLGATVFHEFVQSWSFAWTASSVMGSFVGAVAYRIMLREMRKLS